MKRSLMTVLALLLALSLTACNSGTQTAADAGGDGGATESGESGASGGDGLVAGVCWYQYSDTFIASARMALEATAEADGGITIISADSQFDVATQTNNLNNFYTQGVDFICVNNINTSASAELIEQAKENDVAILFINTTSPSEEELASYDRVYHISSAAEQSGVIMGEQVADYWLNNPGADRNGNGQLDYIMLLGMQDHYDTLVRAQYSVETVEQNGIPTNAIQELIAEYSRSEAQNQVASILQARGDDVDAIFACNDDMALGAIEALKAAGYFTDESNYIPVVGVDATVVGVEAIREGTLLGTSLNNPFILSDAIYKTMQLLAAGEEITQENMDMDGIRVEGKHVYIDYVSITAANPDDADIY